MMGSDKKILVWAVDPLEEKTKLPAGSVASVCAWARDLGWDIQPVCVASPTPKDLERGLLTNVNRLQDTLDDYLEGYASLEIRAGRVILNDEGTQAGAVAALLRFADREGAAAVAVSSHGRSGLDRAILGSFAEQALRVSPVPLLFLGHEPPATAAARNRTALFPTNFSRASQAAYRSFLRFAAAGKFRVTVFHAVAYPLPPAGGMGVYLPDDYVEDQEKWAKEEAQRWVEDARKAGVPAEGLVRTGGVGFLTGDAVLEAARDLDAALVVMTATSNSVDRLLLGSVAYPVFRACRYPTLVFGPLALAVLRGEAEKAERPVARAEG